METLLNNWSIRKQILKVAWPSIVEQLLIMMVGMVSTMFVGRINKETMAAVGMVNMIIFFLQTIFSGLSTGVTVVIARVMGAGNKEKAKLALIQSIIMCLLIGGVTTILGYIFAVPLLKIFLSTAEPEVFKIALLYYKMVFISLPFLVLDMIIASALRGSGDTKTPMYVTAFVNVINLMLSSTLIFGIIINGSIFIPAFGIKGAAISVITARISGAIIRIFVLYFGHGKLKLSFKDKYTIQPQMMLRIIRVGIPAFLEQFVMQGGFLSMNILVISISTTTAAAYQVGTNVNSLAFMPIFGFAIAATTLVGQALGNKDYAKSEIFARETTIISIIVISFIGLLIFTFARPLAMLYTEDESVIIQGVSIIRTFAVLTPITAVLTVCSSVLRTAGDIMYVLISSIVGLWSLRIFLAFSLHKLFDMGVYGIMIGISSDFLVRSCMYWFRMKKGNWKYIKV